MERLAALLAELLSTLHRSAAPDICPGGWAWSVSIVGIVVGLMPAVGAVVVALLRKRIGSYYGAVEGGTLAALGVVSAGLLPLLAVVGTGRVFQTAARAAALPGADSVPGLSAGDLQDLAGSACFFVGPQVKYLGGLSVADSFVDTEPGQLVVSIVMLALLPIVVSMFVAAQARLALRRGPSWPAKFFWLPTLAVAGFSVGQPAGATGHLWVGAVVGSFIGIVAVLMAGTPSREVVRRSLARSGHGHGPPGANGRRPGQPSGQQPRPRPTVQPAVAPRPPVNPRPPAAQHSGQRSAPVQRVAPPLAPLAVPPAAPPTPHRPPGAVVAAAAPFPAVPPLLAGPRSPRFRLIRRLGSGGFGRVWLAHDAKLGHVVALKAAHAPDAETEQRIQREAGALAAVRHPHCVRIYDMVPAASDPGLVELEGMVIVMGYVDGTSLGDLVRARGVLDDIAAARVWLSVAGALDAAHNQGVMHRDVKPGNVVVDTGGLAHLIDFGIARKTGDATMTMAGFVLGTPDFLSPEAACGERATPASDAWQLGATVSYALTGHPPRGGHTDAVSGLRAAASGAALTHLPRRTAHLALLKAAMDNDPTRRPPLRAVQHALNDWLRKSGVDLDGPVTAGGTPVH